MADSGEVGLSSRELAAVVVGLHDAQRYGCASRSTAGRGWLRRVTGAIFGRRRPTPLADPRLEALRLFICANHLRCRPRSELVASLRDVGFHSAQIELFSAIGT